MKEHFYSSTWIDRCEERRSDREWLDARIADPSTRVVPVWRQRNLVRLGDAAAAVEVPLSELPAPPARDDLFFLGLDGDGCACFALAFHEALESPDLPDSVDGEFAELKRVGATLDAYHAGLLAYSRAVVYWHMTHRYCGSCGSPTRVERAGWLRVCTREDCGREHFPRTDPAVIMRVEHGDKVLLGRQRAWPKKWYSVLAGFVEPGESLEEAVRREVAEEVGVVVSDVRYDSSQPWPFPASLMVGFSATAETTEIKFGDDELADARWFTREEIRAGVETGELRISPKLSISRHLLDQWLDREA